MSKNISNIKRQLQRAAMNAGQKCPPFLVTHLDFDWPSPRRRYQLNQFERVLLYLFERQKMETFFFCDDSDCIDVEHFVAQAVARGIPSMLCWLFVTTLKVEFSVACYVKVDGSLLVFTSDSISIEHYYDAHESVNVLWKILQGRIEQYLLGNFGVRLANCEVKRLRLDVKRTKNYGSIEECLTLPLQFRSLLVHQPHYIERIKVIVAVAKHLADANGNFPDPVNDKLYRLVQSTDTKKLSLVLHYAGDCSLLDANKRNFVIIADMFGNFNNVLEVSGPSTCREEQAITVKCERCDAKFTLRPFFELHQQLRCDQDLNVDTLDPDTTFEKCIPITRNEYSYSWYGVMI